MLRWDRCLFPRPTSARLLSMRHQFQLQTIRIDESQNVLVEALAGPVRRHPRGEQSWLPIVLRGFGDAERSHLHLSHARAASAGHRPGEEGENAPWRSKFVAKIEVIRTRIVEVYGSLDQPQPQHFGVKVQITLRVRGDRGNVVNPENRLFQCSLPLEADSGVVMPRL